MALTLNTKFLGNSVTEKEIDSISQEILSAQKTLNSRSGEGNEFLGWVDLPVDYDKEEFDRIKKAAKKIQNSCDIFIVIGIGGSYLGARAAIEFVKSPFYNNIAGKKTPDIYFAGNSISPSALSDLIKICGGKDICINVVSKSGTTTEPAIAFRVFRSLLEKKYGFEGAKERIFVCSPTLTS